MPRSRKTGRRYASDANTETEAVAAAAGIDISATSDENSPMAAHRGRHTGPSFEEVLSKPFDSKRARATLEGLLETGDVRRELEGILSEFRSVAREHEKLRTEGAERTLREYRGSVDAERTSERSAMDALRFELEGARAELAKTKAELSKLRDDPPPPSNDVIRGTELFRRAASELAHLREEVQTLRARAETAESERNALDRILERGGGGGGSGGEEDQSTVLALFEAMTGLEAKCVGDEKFLVSALVDGQETSFLMQYPTEEEQDEDAPVVITADRNPHLLPECLQEPHGIECPPETVPLFLRDLIDHFAGDDETEA